MVYPKHSLILHMGRHVKARREEGNSGPRPVDGPPAPALEIVLNLCRRLSVAHPCLFFAFFSVKEPLASSSSMATGRKSACPGCPCRSVWPWD